ncbi:MAG: molybdate ABC transporter substrate-binding protein [Phycisphaerae bacterium]
MITKSAAVLGLAAVLSVVLLGCRKQDDAAAGRTVMVSAAASTTEAVAEIARVFEARTGIPVELNFASSGQLARQVADGAPVDLVLSANPKWMDFLAEKDLIVSGSRSDLLANELVLIAPAGRRFGPEPPEVLSAQYDLPSRFAGRLALGDPSHVPAGAYAKAALESLNWWRALADRLAPTKDVRSALAFVERGEVELGIVYATDAAASDKVERLSAFPAGSHPPIRYPVALTAAGNENPSAGPFYSFLHGKEAGEIFRRHGFVVLDHPEP